MATMPEKRVREEFKVYKVEFGMGSNDIVDIRAGGPGYLSFWVFTDLQKENIEKVVKDDDVQREVKRRGGSGFYTVRESWAEKYVSTEEELKKSLIELAKTF